jgi:DNA-directed RNA polymerase specialized sigma24 family protein
VEITNKMRTYCNNTGRVLCKRLKNRVDQDDIAQAGLIRLWQTPDNQHCSWNRIAYAGMIDCIRKEIGRSGKSIVCRMDALYTREGKIMMIPHPDNPDNNKMYKSGFKKVA